MGDINMNKNQKSFLILFLAFAILLGSALLIRYMNRVKLYDDESTRKMADRARFRLFSQRLSNMLPVKTWASCLIWRRSAIKCILNNMILLNKVPATANTRVSKKK